MRLVPGNRIILLSMTTLALLIVVVLSLSGSGIQTGTIPACDAAHRGLVWNVEASSGFADRLTVCLKRADNTYGWAYANKLSPSWLIPDSIRVVSTFTTNSTTFVPISGLSFTVPKNTPVDFPLSCYLSCSASAPSTMYIGFVVTPNPPSNFQLFGWMFTNSVAVGDVNITTTTPTVLISDHHTAGAMCSSLIHGMLELPGYASDTTISVVLKSSSASAVDTVFRGSYCDIS